MINNGMTATGITIHHENGKIIRSIKKPVLVIASCLFAFILFTYGAFLYYEQRNHKMQFDITSVSVEPYNNTFKDFSVDTAKGTYLLIHIAGNVRSWFYSPYTYKIQNINAVTAGSYYWDYCTGIKSPLVVNKFQTVDFELSCVINIADDFNFSKLLTKDEFIHWVGGMPFVASKVTKTFIFGQKQKNETRVIQFWIQDSTETFNHIEFNGIDESIFRIDSQYLQE